MEIKVDKNLKFKLFEPGFADFIEKEVNDWLQEHVGVTIVKMNTSLTKYSDLKDLVSINILYLE